MNTVMWRVEVEDLTHLGGPMGTEYTTTTATKMFSTIEKAIIWIEKQVILSGHKPSEVLYINKPDLKSWDCGYIGYSLSKISVDKED